MASRSFAGEHARQFVFGQPGVAAAGAVALRLAAVEHGDALLAQHREARDEAHRGVGVAQGAEGGDHLRVLGPRLVGVRAQERVMSGIDELGRLRGKLEHARPLALEALQGAAEGRNQGGVELRAAAALKLSEALAVAQRRAVGTLAGHRVIAVDDAHRAGDERDLLAGEAVGVAATVEALVVVAHAGDELLVEERAHDLGADAGVLAHELPLLARQRAGLEQHAVGDADLADVVQEGDVLHLFEALLGPAELAPEHGHVGGHAAGVAEGVVVLGAERRAEGAQVAEVEALHLLVELGVHERLGEQLADRFGDGDLLERELTLDMVEQVDEADDLCRARTGAG